MNPRSTMQLLQIAGLLLVVALVAAACSDDGLEAEATSDATPTAEPEGSPTPEPDDSGEDPTADPTAGASDGFAMWPVLADAGPSEACGPGLLKDRSSGNCLESGEPRLGASIIERASARFDASGIWFVDFTITESGIDSFNAVAADCFALAPSCPTGRLAIEWGSEVVSAPAMNAPFFDRDAISISGNFDQTEAESLANALSQQCSGAVGIFFEPGTDPVIVEAAASEVRDFAGVVDTTVFGSEESYTLFEELFADSPELLDAVSPEQVPLLLQVTGVSQDVLAPIAQTFSPRPEVLDVVELVDGPVDVPC